MEFFHGREIAEQRARLIRLIVLDVDGVLTDGGIYHGNQGEEMKRFHVQDGLGIRMAQSLGLTFAIITGRKSHLLEHRAQELGIRFLWQGVKEKNLVLAGLLADLDLDASAAAHMGDDLNDLPILTQVGLAAGPRNAHPAIHQHLHVRTKLGGGQGAVRQFVDFVLGCQGQYENLMERYGGNPWTPS